MTRTATPALSEFGDLPRKGDRIASVVRWSGTDTPTKAATTSSRANFTYAMDAVHYDRSREFLEMAAKTAKRADASDRAAEQLLDAAMAEAVLKQTDREMARSMARNCRQQAVAFRLVAVEIATGMGAETIAPADYPTILDAVFIALAR